MMHSEEGVLGQNNPVVAPEMRGGPSPRPAREEHHRDAQSYESLAIKLRKIGHYLTHSLRAQADIGQLNSQLASLTFAADLLEWFAQNERTGARLSDGAPLRAKTGPASNNDMTPESSAD